MLSRELTAEKETKPKDQRIQQEFPGITAYLSSQARKLDEHCIWAYQHDT